MANNYLVLNEPSGLIEGAITTSHKPTDTRTMKFIKVSDDVLDEYYFLEARARKRDMLVEFSSMSIAGDKTSHFVAVRLDTEGKTASETLKRETEIKEWIQNNPEATFWDLSDEFYLGSTVAKAYWSKYANT